MRATFLTNVGFAAAGALTAGALWWVMPSFASTHDAPRILLACVGLAGLVYTIATGSSRAGRIALPGIWIASTAVLAVVDGPLALHGALHLGLIWIARCWFRRLSPLLALADAVVVALSAVAGLWALVMTGSVALAVWTLLLVLSVAFHVVVPRAASRPGAPFEQAYRSAEGALSRL
ncbi:MAG: hypothetical protein AAF458_19065 [Pseudomonadota bacterium]